MFTTWLEQHMLPCPVKSHLHIDCPGCGSQRSIIALLRGDIAEAWNLYPPGIFLVLTMLVLILHLTFGLKHGALLLKLLTITTVSVTVVNYIYKILNHQLI